MISTSPVILYSVPCPERTYDVAIDIYECGPDEKLFDGVDFRNLAH